MSNMIMLDTDDAGDGATAFGQAPTVATPQSNRLPRLRAALSLARPLRQPNRRTEAHDLLNPIYAVFTGGFEEPDLQAAKALLAEPS
jgi:predicted ATPase